MLDNDSFANLQKGTSLLFNNKRISIPKGPIKLYDSNTSSDVNINKEYIKSLPPKSSLIYDF